MYSNYYGYPVNNSTTYQPYIKGQDDDRIIGGGFLGPFLLGGLAGAALTPGWGRPYYNNYYYPAPYPVPYPYPRRRYYYRPYPRYYY